MLTNVLPGLREVRAPLTAGLIWLLAVYLGVAPYLPTRNELEGAYADLYDLAVSAGTPVILATTTFVAYVVGVLLRRAIMWTTLDVIVRRIARSAKRIRERWGRDPHGPIKAAAERHGPTLRRKRMYATWRLMSRVLAWSGEDVSPPVSADPLAALTRRAGSAVKEVRRREALPTFSDHLPNLPSANTPLGRIAVNAARGGDAVGELVDFVLRQLPQTRLQLLARSEALHSEIDRKVGEADFRLQIAPPLLLLGVVLMARSALLLGLFVLLAALGLFIQGVQLAHEGNDDLLSLDDLPISALEQIRLVAMSLETEGRGQGL